MSPSATQPRGLGSRFPRVSGYEPYMPTLKAMVDGFSPREWG